MTDIKATITAEDFKAATGQEPENDDLERCNCPDAGKVGHHMCGWDEETNLPWFMSPNAPAWFAKLRKQQGAG
jgi:hypothetical protein